MKYVIVLGDGMADEPIEALGGKTPLEYARTPVMDDLAGRSQVGLACTIPEGMKPGSDTANLAVLGYNPRQYYTGRSPLEALSIGVNMRADDIAIRTNLITLSEDEEAYEDKIILDHSSDEISTEDAAILLEAVRKELEDDIYKFYVGTSYRHLLIWAGGSVAELTPPHDVLGQKQGIIFRRTKSLEPCRRRAMRFSLSIPSIWSERQRDLNLLIPAGSGEQEPARPFPLLKRSTIKGAMISAVDLLKGIAVGTGMTNISVEGANGGLHTNYEGKAQAAADAL